MFKNCNWKSFWNMWTLLFWNSNMPHEALTNNFFIYLSQIKVRNPVLGDKEVNISNLSTIIEVKAMFLE